MGKSFATTRWTLVQAAGDSRNPDSRAALASLCEQYWPPVYVFIRAQGRAPDDAREFTQDFFLHLLESHALAKADPGRGRFRSFLMESTRRFLRDEWRKSQAQKRGKGVAPVSLDVEGAEDWLALAHGTQETPETLFDRRWAASVLDRALRRVQERMREAGGEDRFLALKPFLTGDGADTYSSVAGRLAMSEGAVKVAIHRLRRDYGSMVREEVSHTLTDPDMVEDELRILREALVGES